MRTSLLSLWHILSISVALGSPFALISKRIYQDKRVHLTHFRVLTYAVTGVLVVTAGPLLESFVWLALNKDVAIAWDYIIKLLVEDCLCSLFVSLQFGLLPGALAGVLASTGRTLKQQILRASFTAILALSLVDLVYAFLSARSVSQPLLFSLASDIIGGVLAAFLIAPLNYWAHELLTAPLVKGRRLYAAVYFAKLVGVVAFAATVIVATIYFVIIHQLPSQVHLTVEGWTTLELEYALRDIDDPNFQDSITAGVLTKAAHFSVSGKRLVTSVRPATSSTKPDHAGIFVSVSTSSAESSPTPTGEPPSSRVRTLFESLIPPGDIIVQGGDLNPYLLPGNAADMRLWVSVQRGTDLILSKNPNDLRLFKSDVLARGPFPEGGAFALLSRQTELKLSGVSQLLIIPNWPVDVSRSTTRSWQIYLPGQRQPIAIDAEETRCCRGPMILITVRSKDKFDISFEPNTSYVEFRKASYDLVDLGTAMMVNKIRMSDPQGKSLFSTSPKLLGEGDQIYIRGEKLRIWRDPKDALKVSGESRLVVMNGDVLSNSIWTSIPIQIRWAMLVPLLGAFWWWLREKIKDLRLIR